MEAPRVPSKPLPQVTPWSAPFWEAAKRGELKVQKCRDCGKPFFYPRIACPHCFSEDLEWVRVSGRGKIYSFSVVLNYAPSAFAGDVPYVVAIVELEEGLRMLTNIVTDKPESLRCEMPVEVIFEPVSEDFVLPKFRPVEEA